MKGRIPPTRPAQTMQSDDDYFRTHPDQKHRERLYICGEWIGGDTSPSGEPFVRTAVYQVAPGQRIYWYMLAGGVPSGAIRTTGTTPENERRAVELLQRFAEMEGLTATEVRQ